MLKVTMQHPGKPKKVLGIFNDISDARLFIAARIEWDEKIDALKTIYEIHKDNQIVGTSTWDKEEAGQAKQVSYAPTPMPSDLV